MEKRGEREMSKMVFSDERRGGDRGRSLSLFLLPLGLRPLCTYGRRRRIYAGGGVALRPGWDSTGVAKGKSFETGVSLN